VKRVGTKDKVAVDTNVLVRYFTWDDEKQALAAAKILESVTVTFVSTVVLCELVWVLKRAYGYGDGQVANAIRQLMQTRSVELDHAAAETGLRLLAKGGDFADGVIQFDARAAHCDRLVTLDKKFARDGDVVTIKLLT
jgi:predicted nucleic-acid-binding protein